MSYHKATLDNGVNIVSETHTHVRSVSIGVWVKVGSLFEQPSENGLSHCVEHMVFKGTEKRSALEIATALESLGGDLNAFTDREFTCYHATVLKEHLSVAVDVLSDIVTHPAFDAKELDRERRVLLQEVAMVKDTPEDWIVDCFFKNVWGSHSLGQPILGTRATIAKMNRNRLKSFFEAHYRPDNLVVSAAGNLNATELQNLCEKSFSFGPTQKRLNLKPPSPKFHRRHKFIEADREQLQLLVGFETDGFRGKHRFGLLVLSFFLGGGMSSRLFQEIREKAALAYSVDCDFVPFSDVGLLTISIGVSPRSVGKCLDILAKEMERLKSEPPTARELDVVKGQLKGTILLSGDQMETRQESLGRNEILFGKFVSVDEVVREIDRVTPEELSELAKTYFVSDRESVLCMGRKLGSTSMNVVGR